MGERSGPGLYDALRDRFLTLHEHEPGVPPALAGRSAWGLLMEIGQVGGAATLLCVADGTTSLYRTNGAVTAGAGSVASVAEASVATVALVEAALERFDGPPTSVVGQPDRIALIALTPGGPRGTVASVPELLRPDHPLAAVFRQATRALREALALEAAARAGRGAPPEGGGDP